MPFIFQLPATSGRIPGVMVIVSSGAILGWRPPYQNQATKQSTRGAEGRYCPSFRQRACANAQKSEVTMLDSLRTAAGTWVAKLLLLILVVSFAVWGISGQMVGGLAATPSSRPAAPTCRSIEYRLAYDRQINVLSQQFGQRLTREQATALGIDNQVLAQLVAGAVLDEQARKLGLGLSEGPARRTDAGRSGLPGSRTASSTASSSTTCCARSACGRKTISGIAPRWRCASRSSRRFRTASKAPGHIPAGRRALSWRGPHRRVHRAAEVAGRADRGADRCRAFGLVRGEQGELCRAGIPQDSPM